MWNIFINSIPKICIEAVNQNSNEKKKNAFIFYELMIDSFAVFTHVFLRFSWDNHEGLMMVGSMILWFYRYFTDKGIYLPKELQEKTKTYLCSFDWINEYYV